MAWFGNGYVNYIGKQIIIMYWYEKAWILHNMSKDRSVCLCRFDYNIENENPNIFTIDQNYNQIVLDYNKK